MELNVDDIIGTGFRQVEEVFSAPEHQRQERYQRCRQTFRELGLMWGFLPENAETLASNMTIWVRDVVALLERPGNDAVELKLPKLDTCGPVGDLEK